MKKYTCRDKSGKERVHTIANKAPKGFTRVEGAMTTPVGTALYSNNKSLLNKQRKSVLVFTDKKAFLERKKELDRNYKK